jgi:hypothetical protein
MKSFYLIGFFVALSLSAFSQQTYVSKEQIKIGKYENGQVNIGQTKATFIVKTDFDFKSVIGSRYSLKLITDNNDVLSHHLTLRSVKWKREEKIYEFEVDESEGEYPKTFLQITVEPHAKYNICVVIQNEVGQFLFYCKKV